MNNQIIKQLQSLKQTKFRKLHGKFLIEGKRLVKAGLDWGSSVETLFCTKSFYDNNIDTWDVFSMIDRSILKIIDETQFKKISSTTSPSGIGARCKIREHINLDLNQAKWIYLDRIRDPGNLGTILRSACWFNLKNIAISPQSVDPYNPKAIRAGMGAHFGLRIYNDIELDNFINTHSIIAGNNDGKDLSNFKFPEKHVIVFGNEAHGISMANKKLIQDFITIKKLGQGESLNLASAASILMHEITKDQ